MDKAYPTVIVADGIFPVHEIPIGYLTVAERIICCDGSARALIGTGLEPTAIVGDMDSLGDELTIKFSDRLFPDRDQETNDLTKAVKWCVSRGFRSIAIVGATGKREDHTIGNISLLSEYAKLLDVIMVTDSGIIRPYNSRCTLSSLPGQQVSVFSIDPETEITSFGLRYPLRKSKLKNWWEATLNEATGDSFTLDFTNGRLIVFTKFAD